MRGDIDERRWTESVSWTASRPDWISLTIIFDDWIWDSPRERERDRKHVLRRQRKFDLSTWRAAPASYIVEPTQVHHLESALGHWRGGRRRRKESRSAAPSRPPFSLQVRWSTQWYNCAKHREGDEGERSEEVGGFRHVWRSSRWMKLTVVSLIWTCSRSTEGPTDRYTVCNSLSSCDRSTVPANQFLKMSVFSAEKENTNELFRIGRSLPQLRNERGRFAAPRLVPRSLHADAIMIKNGQLLLALKSVWGYRLIFW